jgi:hypothetical protein
MPYPIHRGCYLFWPKCVGERLLSIGAPLTLGILTWLASRLTEKIDLRGTRLRVVVYGFHHYGVPSPHIGVFHGKNDYGRGYAEYCKTESILNAASKDIFASEGLDLLEFLFPSSDSLADWTQIWDQMKNVKPDPIAFELRNANGDDFDPAFLCSIQQPVEISGEINSILDHLYLILALFT